MVFGSLERALNIGLRMTLDAGLFDSSKELVIANACESEELRRLEGCVLVQNYYPYYKRLQKYGYRVMPALEQQCEQMLIIGSRVREVNRQYIAQARSLVSPGGTVAMSVANEFGSKSSRKDFNAVFEDATGDSKGHCRVFWGSVKGQESKSFKEWMHLNDPGLVKGTDLCAAVGNFSYRKPDAGSQLLLSVLPELEGRGADLGAGYGLLGKAIISFKDVQELYAVEADWSAVQAGIRNLADSRVRWIWGDVTDSSGLLDSCRISQDGRLDWVVMNPPFHTEANANYELGIQFFRSALSLLRPKGKLFWVANQHISYPGKFGWKSSCYSVLAEDKGFVVGCYNVAAR